MSGIARSSIIRGPALVTFGGATFFAKGDIAMKPVRELLDIQTSHAGTIDRRDTNRRWEISFEPAGELKALTVLCPHATTLPGASIFGAADSPLVIHTIYGIKYTFHAAAVTTMPALRFGVGATLFGQVTFTSILKNYSAPETANSYYTVASEPYPGSDDFSGPSISTVGYFCGIPPIAGSFRSETPFEVAFDLQLRPENVDGLGTIDMTFVDLDVSVTATPVGVSMTEILASLENQQKYLGADRHTAENLSIAAYNSSLFFYLMGAALYDSDLGHGSGRRTVGQCVWRGTNKTTRFYLDKTDMD